MKLSQRAARMSTHGVARMLSWAQVNKPGLVAKAIQFAIAHSHSSAKAPEDSHAPRTAGLQAAAQAAGVPEPLRFERTSGIVAASAIAAITPAQSEQLAHS
ncbi:hypothetical protein CCICO_06195 [Corynebacterium ciconiae DSM 44920]|uniref:hypothetical protein n=1 Tax=Corynebacterium ciconiae TaxID=227319 RepID=UPI000377A08E|nr:hypothetical protein [Corynebacterium ciconiae]WKD61266.1 hypothetical protein CCICO_06195 [Corynebacterium ciconiae DSM 44920]